jgi:hypothetical protein
MIGFAGCRSPIELNPVASPGGLDAPITGGPPTRLPEFTLAFIPLGWHSSSERFEEEARRQAAYFIQESGIEQYFQVQVVLLESEPGLLQTGYNPAFLDQIVRYGKSKIQAERYIGLAEGDLVDVEIKDLRGWTSGPGSPGVVVESGSERLLAHELGHTFGLCDEYNYDDWQKQNKAYPSGCPNRYPRPCPRLHTEEIICIGEKTNEGRFSLMGPSGLGGEYGYNAASLRQLNREFTRIARQMIREK